jgi:Family of unknown function (DUF6441)
VFILVPQVRLGKRLDVASAAAKAARELPGRIIRNWPEIN